MAILVTGGAGYIGSHTVAELLERGEEVVVIDNLVTGHREALLGGKLYEGDLRDKELLAKLFSENDIEAVIHFAASSLVGESMKDPVKYYDNNVYGTQCLLEAMQKAGVNKIVFSSTAATYGEPEKVPIEETVKGFKGLCDGDYDHLPEPAFYMVGTIEDAVKKAEKLAADAA